MNIPKYVKIVIEKIEQSGNEAFAVGGCVRDFIMGKEPFDYDVTTSASPDIIKQIFSDYKTVDTGIKHGTVTVFSDSLPIEITTYRIDGGYTDSRHPDEVCFTSSLEDDLARRDFTMNAIAFGEKSGYVDPFGGREDIKRGLISCVGEPKKRFSEDALRILRALRFAATLDFKLDEATKLAVYDCCEGLRNVSAERIATELKKLLCGRAAGRILCEFCSVFEVFIPDLSVCRGFSQNTPYHIYDVLEHTAVMIDSLPNEVNLRFAALFHDIAKPICYFVDENGRGHFKGHDLKSAEIAEMRLKALKLDNFAVQRVTRLVKYHDMRIDASERAVKRVMAKLSPELFFELVKIQRADNAAKNPDLANSKDYYDELEEIALKIINEKQCLCLSDLAVNGGDLMSEGMAEGKEIGIFLGMALDAVIDGVIPNEKEKIMEYLRGIYENRSKKA